MAKDLDLKSITLEQGSIGGTVYSFPRQKIVMTHPMELPLHGKVKLTNTSKAELLELWQSALSKNEIEIKENTQVQNITPLTNGTFRVDDSKGNSYKSNHVIVAIGRGGTPRKLNVQGEDLAKVAYRVLEPEDIEDKNIMVVGGGDSAVETAMLLKEHNNVSLSYRKDQFARIKLKNAENIQKCIADKSVNVLFSSTIEQINEDSIYVNFESQPTQQLENDLVFILIGGELPISFLKNAGIEINKRFGKIVKKY